MSLVKITQEGPSSRRGCPFGKWAASLPPDESAALQHMLTERTAAGSFRWSAAAAADEIANDEDYDVDFGHQAVYRHRIGACSCAR